MYKNQIHSNLKTDDKLQIKFLPFCLFVSFAFFSKPSIILINLQYFPIPIILKQSLFPDFESQTKQQMYPKVKVRLHDQQEDQFSPQDDHRKLLLANIHAVKEIKSCSSPLLARLTMEAYAPKLPRQSISPSKENSKNLGKATTPDARACLVLRPRAVLSSPENDGMIGSINKIVDRKNSPAIKVQNPNTATSSAQRPHQEAKKAPSQAKKKATATARPVAMNTNKGSNIKTFFNSNNGDVKSKFQKPLVGKQHASLGTWKPSFTSS